LAGDVEEGLPGIRIDKSKVKERGGMRYFIKLDKEAIC